MTPVEKTGRQTLLQALSRLGVGVVYVDPRGRVGGLSPFAERLTGWSVAEAEGKPVEKVFRVTRKRQGVTQVAGGLVHEGTLIARTGQRFTVEYTVVPEPVIDRGGAAATVVFHDVSQRKLADLQVARRASHDPLTGLLNREAFSAAIEKALGEIERSSRPIAICQIDIGQLGLINKTCGHAAGDNLIQWVAALLREEVRESDVLARMAGDVFAVLHTGTHSLDDGRRVAESVIGRLQHFLFTWADKTFPVGASIGLVPVTRGSYAVADVLRAADHACTSAASSGRNQISICSLEDEELSKRRQEIEWVSRIRKNLHEGGVTLFAQPIVPISRGEPDGLHFEVLMRIPGENGLLASAAQMIRATERFGLMAHLDHWVIRTTLQVLKEQPREVIDRLRLCSINISGVSLHDRTVSDFIREQLSESGVPAEKICFELTETAAVENLKMAQKLIMGLQSIGCRFALDDFGMGVASYAHLKHLPVDYLKIAGDFVEDIAVNPMDHALVESIAQIGKVMGIRVVAEAVSSAGALEALRSIGVDYAQGNYVGHPQPLGELLAVRAAVPGAVR